MIIAGSVSDDQAREIYPDGWKSPKPYIRIVPDPHRLGARDAASGVASAAPLAFAVAGTVPRPRTRTDRMLHGDAHVDAYRRTDGDEGYEWKNGSHIILLTTTGHRSASSGRCR